QTPSHYESTDDEAYDDVAQSGNAEEEEVVLERRDTEMTDASPTNLEATQATEDTHVVITAVNTEVQQHSSSISSGFITNMLNPNPDTGI
ncbi:hypothetical protein Tco_0591982, partial [Tanacetum coccineum]